jgi:hypothetical protein
MRITPLTIAALTAAVVMPTNHAWSADAGAPAIITSVTPPCCKEPITIETTHVVNHSTGFQLTPEQLRDAKPFPMPSVNMPPVPPQSTQNPSGPPGGAPGSPGGWHFNPVGPPISGPPTGVLR